MDTIKELREMSDEQLRLTVKEATDTLFKLKIQAQTERLDAPSELRRSRRLIARVKTIQTERQNADKQTNQKIDAAQAETAAANS